VSLLVIGVSPAVVLAGELVNRRYRDRPARMMSPFLANPVWIALTAPSRWILSITRRRIRRNGGGRRRPPFAGVREPRRPKPTLPAAAMALREPRWPGL
jgi:hypothetical protein